MGRRLELMLESAVEARLRLVVRRAGGRTYKFAPIVKGNPDQIVMLPGGRVYFVELKTRDGRLSPAQRLWHRRAAELGITVVVLAGVDEVNNWIREVTSD